MHSKSLSSSIGETSPPLATSDRLHNEDIAPMKDQSWGIYNLSAMWMSNVHSVAGYVFAASLFTLGLGGFQVFTALITGILLIYFFTNMAGRAGQKYGIAFAAFCRPAFGVFGANIPSMIKASTATCWYGIQTWVASTALVVVTLRLAPGAAALNDDSILGMSTLGWICFLIMWFSQLAVFYYGWEAIRKFTDWAGPAIYLVMFIMAGWIVWKAGGLEHIDFSLGSERLSGAGAVSAWFTAVAFTVAWFAGTTLNFADFSRFMKSERAMTRANFLGLPINFALFALVTVVTTSGALKVFGELITDPVHLVAKLDNVTAIVLGALTFMTATIATNIVANFVSAAMDLTNLAPKYLTFRRAGVLASLISVMVMPWKLYANAAMVQYTLGTLGAFIGPIFGVIICDYFIVRKQTIDLESLYSEDPRGKYWYRNGFNPKAIVALVVAGILSLSISQLEIFKSLAAFSWFFGAFAGGVLHYLLSGQKAQKAWQTIPARQTSS